MTRTISSLMTALVLTAVAAPYAAALAQDTAWPQGPCASSYPADQAA